VVGDEGCVVGIVTVVVVVGGGGGGGRVAVAEVGRLDIEHGSMLNGPMSRSEMVGLDESSSNGDTLGLESSSQ
jgi:hypothetical protein